MKHFFKLFSFLPALILMYYIFSFSGQTGEVSGSLSYKVSCKVIIAADDILNRNLSNEKIEYYAGKIEHPVRKLAHMSEYFLLAVCVSFPMYVYRIRGIFLPLGAGFFCVAFAASDEFHQTFIEGRGPSIKDVGIDSIGIFVGILVVQYFCWHTRKTLFPHHKTNKRKKRHR